jgi:hypothetical protein
VGGIGCFSYLIRRCRRKELLQIRFEVLTAVKMLLVYWLITPYGLVNVSEEHAASICRASDLT